MIRFWDILKNNLTTVKNISAIGIADIESTAISAAFWLSSTANCAYLIIMNNKMKSDKSPSMIS
jgi:hypothetical protein